MQKLIIKTNENIGKFLNNSFIDNIPIREVNESDLKDIPKEKYEIITIDSKSIKK